MSRAWVEEMARLPFVKGAKLRAGGRGEVDAELVIHTACAMHRLLVEEKRTYLTTAMAAQAAVQMRPIAPDDVASLSEFGVDGGSGDMKGRPTEARKGISRRKSGSRRVD